MNTSQIITRWIAFIAAILLFVSCSNDNDEVGGDVKIKLSETEIAVEVGKTTTLVAGFEPSEAPNKAHSWTSEDPTIASVDASGVVTGRATGTTRITATALCNNSTATCIVKVVNKIIHVTSLSLNTTSLNLSLDDTYQLTATVSPSTATVKDVTWSSSDSSIASVDDNGMVKANGLGEAVITATCDGKSTTCKVTVSDKTVQFSDISYTSDQSSILFKAKATPVGVNISELGICWNQNQAPTINDSHYAVTSKKDISVEITNLKPESSYYVRAYAKAGNVVYYSATSEVKTLRKLIVKFKLEEAYKDTYDGANDYTLKISTPILDDYPAGISACYGVAPHPEITDNLATMRNMGTQWIYELKNLKGSQDYYIRPYRSKNNLPVYFPEEAKFSTIGKEVILDAKYTGGSRLAEFWTYTLNYTLPNKDDIYEVIISGAYDSYIGKSSSDVESSYLNVKGGSGKLYIKMKHWRYYDTGWNGSATITFKNLGTGTTYKIRIGDYNRGF